MYVQQFELIITEWTDKLQDLQHALEETESLISRRSSYAQSDYVTPDKGREASTQNISDYQDLIENAKSQRSEREQELAELKAYMEKNNIAEGTEEYYSMIAEIQEVENEIDSLNASIIDYSNSISEEYVNIFDSLSTEYTNKLELMEHTANEINEAIEQAEAKGRLSSETYYEELLKLERDNIGVMEDELSDLQTAFYDALASGEIEVGSQAFYDMQGEINDCIESIQEAQTEVIELNNQIRQISWDNFDYLEDTISKVVDEADFLIDLLSEQDLFTDNGQLTDAGTSTVGLHAVNYNMLMSQADDYAEQIAAINEEIANDPANTDLIERQQELVAAQQEAILAANEEKQAIADLVQEGIDTEIDSLSELISKYEEYIDTQSDLLDYQKKVKEQTEEISALEKQLSAYSGDNSEEAKATVQKIKVELEEAQSDLEETEYEYYVTEQKKLLDNLLDEYETVLNTRLDDIDALISDMIDYVNINSSVINDTLLTATEDVGYTMSTTMSTIWAEAAASMESSEASRLEQVNQLLAQMVANGTLTEAQAQSIITALGTGDAQGITNASNIITQLVSNGVLTTEQATTLKDAMTGADGSVKSVVSTYGQNFSDKQTTTNDALDNIKTYVSSLAQSAATEAAATVAAAEAEAKAAEAAATAAASSSTASNTTKTDAATAASTTASATTTVAATTAASSTSSSSTATSSSKSTSTSTQGDGKIQVGDKVTFKSGKYYYDSYGTTPSGSKNLGKKVYVTKIVSNPKSGQNYPYAISTGSTLGNGDLGWVKKSQISGYATGLKKALSDEDAWVNEEGLEAILSPSQNAVITHVNKGDSILTAEGTKSLFDFANDPSDYIKGIMTGDTSELIGSTANGSTVNMGDYTFDISLPGVTNYEEFRTALLSDKVLEKYVCSVTVDPLLGKNKSLKNRYT